MKPCREWAGKRNNMGYGQRWDKERKKRVLVHRWVVAQVHGWEAIEGKVVMHVCDNPACFRYDHLCIGSQKDNLQDMTSKGRGPQPHSHCPQGHEMQGDNVVPNGNKRMCRTCKRNRERISNGSR